MPSVALHVVEFTFLGDQLILQGHATDQVWAMRSPTGTIGLGLDDGAAGTVYLNEKQARTVVETLQKMLR